MLHLRLGRVALHEELKASKKIKEKNKPKIKFGVQVPHNTQRAQQLDNENKNTLWANSTRLEIQQILDYEVFKPLEPHEKLPEGYDYIPYHMVYDVKFDGRRKSKIGCWRS